MVEATAVLGTVTAGIEASDKALALYNKYIDQLIPWKTFEDTIKDITKYEKDYSKKAADLVGEVKTLLLNSNDYYLKAVQSVYEWCGVASPLLEAYLELFENYDENKAGDQKTILLKVLGDGIAKMTEAQQSLTESSMSFNKASGKLASLKTQLDHDFAEGSDYYEGQVAKIRKEAYAGAAAGLLFGPFGLIFSYGTAAGVVEGELIPKLRAHLDNVNRRFQETKDLVDKADKDITTAKGKLQEEIKTIGDIKIATENTNLYISLKTPMVNKLKESAGKLIENCKAYMKRHS